MKNIVVGLLCVALLAGCGAHRMSPVAPQTIGDLKPEVEDKDSGLVGVRPDFALKTYSALILMPFKLPPVELKDDEGAQLAKDMIVYLQARLLKNLRAAGIFAKVVDGAAADAALGDEKALRLEGDMTELTEGNRALRYLVGFGAGAAKAQIETRLVDVQTRRVELVTADRRAAAMGVFGGEGRQFLTESMDQMAEGYVKLLKHISGGGKPGAR